MKQKADLGLIILLLGFDALEKSTIYLLCFSIMIFMDNTGINNFLIS
jgi:hypothetical protein